MLGRFSSTVLPSHSVLEGVLRVATYNIHKGVRGLGLGKRLEIHNLGLGIEALDADLVFLQEVRLFHRRDAARFDHTWFGWPEQGQADFLAPEGFSVAYRSNAVTRHGEHGNALLSRWPIGDCGHFDVSDHRFEQRGLLHVPVQWEDTTLHAIVAHLGLIHSSRLRQVQLLQRFIDKHVPAGANVIVAGDFNDWSEKLDPAMAAMGLYRARSRPRGRGAAAGDSTFGESRYGDDDDEERAGPWPGRSQGGPAPSGGRERSERRGVEHSAHAAAPGADKTAHADSAERRRAERVERADARHARAHRAASQGAAALTRGRIAGLAGITPPLDKPTFPSRVPVFALDRIYTRGLKCRATYVPRGLAWTRMSDHLPLVAEFERD